MTKRIMAALLAVALFALPISAGLFGIDFGGGGGGGDIVFDPSVFGQAVLVVSELVKNYEELKALYELEIWKLKVVPVNMALRYRTLGAAWYGLQLPFDRFGNLGPWVQVVNSGGLGLGAYGGASITLKPYGPLFSQLSPEEQQKVASNYATAELADGSNGHSLETAGMLRGNAAAVDQAIRGLEMDSLSLDPAMNTEIAVLNKINAPAIASLRSTRDTNRVLLSNLEQQVIESKRRRDAEASQINAAIARLQFGAEAKAKHTSTITNSLQSFRWP
jgi:hypothetical protein